MFNIGAMELLLVLLVAFLVVGPKDLPKVARWLARQVKSIRKIVKDIQKETGWDEFSKELKDTARDLKDTVKEADITKEVNDAARDVNQSMQDVVQETRKAADAAKEATESKI